MKRVFSVLVVGSALLCALNSSSRAQSLLGQSVEVQYLFPDIGTVYENDGTQTVTAGGVTYNSFGQINTEVLPTQIVQTYQIPSTYDPASFNGVEISEVGGSPATITGVTVDVSTDLPGFVAGDVTFDAHDIFINGNSLSFDPSNQVVLDVSFGGSNSTPEPGALAAFACMSITGLALLRRRRSNEYLK